MSIAQTFDTRFPSTLSWVLQGLNVWLGTETVKKCSRSSASQLASSKILASNSSGSCVRHLPRVTQMTASFFVRADWRTVAAAEWTSLSSRSADSSSSTSVTMEVSEPEELLSHAVIEAFLWKGEIVISVSSRESKTEGKVKR